MKMKWGWIWIWAACRRSCDVVVINRYWASIYPSVCPSVLSSQFHYCWSTIWKDEGFFFHLYVLTSSNPDIQCVIVRLQLLNLGNVADEGGRAICVCDEFGVWEPWNSPPTPKRKLRRDLNLSKNNPEPFLILSPPISLPPTPTSSKTNIAL